MFHYRLNLLDLSINSHNPKKMCFVNGKFGYRKPKINCSFVLILGKREGVKKDSKMSLLGGSGRGSKYIRTKSLFVHFILWMATLKCQAIYIEPKLRRCAQPTAFNTHEFPGNPYSNLWLIFNFSNLHMYFIYGFVNSCIVLR